MQIEPHARRAGLAQKAVDDGFRRVGDREHASIRLGFEPHAAFAEPRLRFSGTKLPEGTQERPAASGIISGQLAKIIAAMGDVAAAASRNADFG